MCVWLGIGLFGMCVIGPWLIWCVWLGIGLFDISVIGSWLVECLCVIWYVCDWVMVFLMCVCVFDGIMAYLMCVQLVCYLFDDICVCLQLADLLASSGLFFTTIIAYEQA